jgi:hypothetical protein
MLGGPEIVFGLVLVLVALYVIVQILQFFVGLAIKAGLVLLTIGIVWVVLKHVVGIGFIPHIPELIPFI